MKFYVNIVHDQVYKTCSIDQASI